MACNMYALRTYIFILSREFAWIGSFWIHFNMLIDFLMQNDVKRRQIFKQMRYLERLATVCNAIMLNEIWLARQRFELRKSSVSRILYWMRESIRVRRHHAAWSAAEERILLPWARASNL
jgi:hypothetical protein